MRSSHSRGSSAATAAALISSANRPQTNRSLLRFVNILRLVLACVRAFAVGIIGRAVGLVRTAGGSRLARDERRKEIAPVHRRGELAVRDHEVRQLRLRYGDGAPFGRSGDDVGAAIDTVLSR